MLLDHDQTNNPIGKVIDQREEDKMQVASGILDFYVGRYPEVYVVTCNKCKENLALEYIDPNKPNTSHVARRNIIELSKSYHSSRWRTDDVMGYECACGNDNRWAYIEWLTTKHDGANFPPHEYQAVKERIASSNHVPDVKIKGRDTVIENKFTVRRLR